MPVIEMRESLGSIDVEFENNQSLVQVVQKRINLKEGSWQRNMLQMDLFFDDFPHVIGGDYPTRFPGYIEYFLSPTPLILTRESLQLTPRRGPDAANPQDFLATNANFPFFHDQLYLTMVFHGEDIDVYPLNVRFSASMYMSYNEKKVKASRSAMGVIAERFQVMIAQQMSNGRILQNPTDLQGDVIPSYTWGGIRPEYMVTANSIANFWLNNGTNEAESVTTTAFLRNTARRARQMVPNPDAFGTAAFGPIPNIPDWFASFLPKGIEAGPVRDQFPPRVTQDNPALAGLGNILMV